MHLGPWKHSSTLSPTMSNTQAHHCKQQPPSNSLSQAANLLQPPDYVEPSIFMRETQSSGLVLVPKFLRSRVVNGSVCKLRGLRTTFISYSFQHCLLKTVKFNSGGMCSRARAFDHAVGSKSMWPCYWEQDHVTMLLRARPCDHANESKSIWPCYWEQEHMTMLLAARACKEASSNLTMTQTTNPWWPHIVFCGHHLISNTHASHHR